MILRGISGRVIAEAVRRKLVTEEARVQTGGLHVRLVVGEVAQEQVFAQIAPTFPS